MNEAYIQPAWPDHVSQADILAGLYCYRPTPNLGDAPDVRLVGSGAILNEVIAAADQLAAKGMTAEVWSATSYSELERTGAAHVSACLDGDAPVIMASDYVKAWPARIAPFIHAPVSLLGTDDFGRSDQREALRHYFGVDRDTIAQSAIEALKTSSA
jgi:pyruvate dehydrogenase E1 component